MNSKYLVMLLITYFINNEYTLLLIGEYIKYVRQLSREVFVSAAAELRAKMLRAAGLPI
jgi:hypothetical protein